MNLRWKEVEINYRGGNLLKRIAYVRQKFEFGFDNGVCRDPFVVTRTKKLRISLEPPCASALSLPELFQTVTSPSLGRSLQRLSLWGHVEMFELLGEYCAHNTPFENLTKLHLDLFSHTQTEIPLALELFIRSLPPTLQLLHIWTSVDPFPLFDALFQFHSPVRFSNLKSLLLYIHVNRISLPKSLSCFLLANSHNLQHLFLDLRMSRGNPEGDDSLGVWLADLVNSDAHFPSLQSLNIYPSKTQAGLSALLILIKRISPTLSSLKISTRDLTFEETQLLVDALTTEGPSALRTLHVNLTHLSVPFLNLLAHKLSQLEELSLRYCEIVGSDQVRSLSFLLLRITSSIASCSIHFTVSSTTDGTTLTSLMSKTYCTLGN